MIDHENWRPFVLSKSYKRGVGVTTLIWRQAVVGVTGFYREIPSRHLQTPRCSYVLIIYYGPVLFAATIFSSSLFHIANSNRPWYCAQRIPWRKDRIPCATFGLRFLRCSKTLIGDAVNEITSTKSMVSYGIQDWSLNGRINIGGYGYSISGDTGIHILYLHTYMIIYNIYIYIYDCMYVTYIYIYIY